MKEPHHWKEQLHQLNQPHTNQLPSSCFKLDQPSLPPLSPLITHPHVGVTPPGPTFHLVLLQYLVLVIVLPVGQEKELKVEEEEEEEIIKSTPAMFVERRMLVSQPCALTSSLIAERNLTSAQYVKSLSLKRLT